MRWEVKAYVESSKCQVANTDNPMPPLKLKPLSKKDYKGPISPQKWYLHTQMDGYSRYPEVDMTRSEKLTELKKVLGKTIRAHRRPDEIWCDGGPPYNSHEWDRWIAISE